MNLLYVRRQDYQQKTTIQFETLFKSQLYESHNNFQQESDLKKDIEINWPYRKFIPQWGPVDIIGLSVCLYVSLSLFPSIYLYLCPVVHIDIWQSKRAARNCAQRMRPQTTGSNT